ncbi:nucleoside-diphosphate sugar epimerase/dehydratase [Brachyspira pulli]|uniref:nucleoside-diphosphate sugar epimerase/dehydratase n=1 Tax=Brachyspira pulli TaxID=310721 RepID=UPI003003F393
MKNIVIIGAGNAGETLAYEVLTSDENNEYNILCFLDDDDNKKEVKINNHSIKVNGKVKDINTIIEEYKKNNIDIEEIIIAIPTLKQKQLLEILNIIYPTGIKYKILPGFFEIIKGNASIKDIRNLEPSDLLGREEIGFDEKEISNYYKDKTILVTGGGGSIGSELVRQLITLPVKKVMALDNSESAIHSLIMSLNDSKNEKNKHKFQYIISNVRDYVKVDKILKEEKPDIIFHAAAHKHLPFMEAYPEEAIKNNILATENIATLAIKNNIKNFIFISTDKAVRPTSLMGASKRICERMIMSLSHEQNNTAFKITRFGNVLGSSGSVIPVFEKQIREGKALTVTHPEMVRFFMSIREAARLVIKACTLTDGVIFTLDMGKPVKILDLARNMLKMYGLTEKDIPIVFTGIREGEKLYEEILMDDETLIPSQYKKLFIAKDPVECLSHEERKVMIDAFDIASLDADKETIKMLMRKYIEEYTG